MSKGAFDSIIKNHQAPDITVLTPSAVDYQWRLGDILNWINYVFSPKELRDFTVAYLERENLMFPNVADVDEWRFVSIGKHAYILMNGGSLSEGSLQLMQKGLDKVRSEAQRITLEKEAKKLIIRREIPAEQLLRAQVHATVQRIEELILTRTYAKADAQVVDIIRDSNLPKHGVNDVIDSLQLLRKEVTDTSDPDYAENIELMGKRALYVGDCLTDALRQLGMEVANKSIRSSRKPKTIKEQQAAKATKNIKHKRIDTEHNVVSIDPAEIVGATSLLVFNSKSNRVGLYVAQPGATLGIKGTTLQNYDEALSISKTLRRVETDLIAFRNATVPKRIEVLLKTNIRGKEYLMNGRINKDTLLLKVFK